MSLQPSQLFRIGLLGVLLLALACAGCKHGGDVEKAVNEEQLAPVVVVRTVTAETRALEETISGIGRSEALPNHLVTLTPAIQGHVHEIRANLGDSVHRGDLIVELDRTVAGADLAEKEANRDTLQATLDLLRAHPRPEDRKGLEIAVEQAKAAVARAGAALDRLRPLRARKEVSEAQLYETEQLLVQAQLQQQSAEAQLGLLLAGPRAEAVEEATARLAAAEEAVGLSRAHLEQHSICSPIDGVLDSLSCHPGQTLAAGMAIGEVVDNSPLNVVIWLPPLAAAKIRPGQPARVTTADSTWQTEASAEASIATDADSAAKVTSVGQVVDPQTGNLPVRVLLDNSQGRIAIGQTLSVAIIIHEHAEELVVPTAALIDLGEGPLVVVVREGRTVGLHPTAVATHGTWTIVSGTDLQAGEQVVIEGGFNLPEGTQVRVEPGSRAAVAEAPR